MNLFEEIKMHGTIDFPIELYEVNEEHPSYEMPFHWHPHIEIIRVIKGNLKISLNKTDYNMKKGDIIFVNSEIVHGSLPQNCIYECLVYDNNFIPAIAHKGQIFSEMISKGNIRINEYFPSCNDEIHTCINLIFDNMKKKEKGYKYSVVGMISHLYGIIIKNGVYSKITDTEKQTSISVTKLKNVLEFIRNNYSNKITLKDMADIAKVSPKYLCSMFKERTHKSPVDYLIYFRVEKAVHFLITTDKSVTEIALECGFDDLSYFIKTFKKLKGVSPGIFRKK